MTSSLIAMGIAIFLVVNLVVGLAGLSLLLGAFETLFGKPKLDLLRSTKTGNFFAFGFRWNSAKEPAKIDTIRVRLFNPYAKPSQIDLIKSFETKTSSFAQEVDMGPGFVKLLGVDEFEKTTIQVEISSTKDGVAFQFDMTGAKFKKLIFEAQESVEQFIQKYKLNEIKTSKPPIDIPERNFIADTVPGKGPLLKIATNPQFMGEFSTAPSGGAGAVAAESVPNFAMLKVWIEPGCIVCNACEDIYPEVFEVLADTCIVRPNPPLDDGLRIVEAAEACPVEVIKYTKP